MSAPLGIIASVNSFVGSKVFGQPKGDLADRLCSRYTVCILAVCSAFMLSGHFFGDPITCWTPAQFNKQWVDFVNQYCYVHGTYFVPFDEELPHDDDERRKQPINYYQWVPYIFALQALMFYMPRFVWKTLCNLSGYDLSGAIRYVSQLWEDIKKSDASFKSRIASFEGRASVFIWDGLRLARKKNSRDLALYYTLSTVIQTANAWFQFYLLNRILGSTEYTFWGPHVALDLAGGRDWQTSGHFPRVTHCDFNRRRPASVQMDTVLCVLTLNIYYEKIFLFLWFWLFFVALISTYNCAYWLSMLCVSKKARRTVCNYLSTSDYDNRVVCSDDKFMEVLDRDGLFVLHQMSLNLGDIPACYLTIAMRNIAERWMDDSSEEGQPLTKMVKAV